MIEHSEASELLAPHLRGELDARAARELSEHLAGCSDCTAELDALEALTAPHEDGLTDIERAGLHREVFRALSDEGSAANDEVIAHPGGTRRLAPWLGAAATVLLVAIGIVSLDLSSSDDEGSSSGSASREFATESDGDTVEAPAEVGGPDIGDDASAGVEALTEGSSGSGGGAAADSSGAATSKSVADVPARFDPDAGTFGTRQLRDYASTQDPFRSFSTSYTASDAERLREPYLDSLADAAGSGGKESVRTCARQVMEQDFPMIPAYGAYGRFDGRDVLVLGFVYAPKGSDLGRYLVWVWPRNSCDSPVKIIAGKIVR